MAQEQQLRANYSGYRDIRNPELTWMHKAPWLLRKLGAVSSTSIIQSLFMLYTKVRARVCVRPTPTGKMKEYEFGGRVKACERSRQTCRGTGKQS